MLPEPLYILYLDRYHMEDTVFLQRLARALARRQRPTSRCLLVHGSGEFVERVLEGEGLFPKREEGVLQVDTAAQYELVERSMRQFNQRLVAMLTDEVVSCVGVQGTSRNLLWRKEGVLVARGAGWIEALVKQGVVPIVSALAPDPEKQRAVEVAAVDVVGALASGLEELDPRVVFFTRTARPGLVQDGSVLDAIALDELPGEKVLAEPEAVRQVVRRGLRVLLTDTTAFEETGEVAGTYVDGP